MTQVRDISCFLGDIMLCAVLRSGDTFVCIWLLCEICDVSAVELSDTTSGAILGSPSDNSLLIIFD